MASVLILLQKEQKNPFGVFFFLLQEKKQQEKERERDPLLSLFSLSLVAHIAAQLTSNALRVVVITNRRQSDAKRGKSKEECQILRETEKEAQFLATIFSLEDVPWRRKL